MIHETAAAWVARRDAGLSATEDAGLQSWLGADPRHRAAFAEYGSAWAVLDRPVGGGMADDVIEKLQSLDRRQHRRRVLSGAAVMAMLLTGISLWTISNEPPAGDAQVIATTAKVLLPARQTLPDGTVVDLKEGAEIVPDFGGAYRRVALRRGEAHFQVAKDAARPFVVEANGIELRAVGTAFAVQLGDKAIEVIVTEGRVAVESPAPGAAGVPPAVPLEPSAAAIVGAGEHALIELGHSAPEVRIVSPHEVAERLAWRAPRLECSGTPLSEVVALLNQHAAPARKVRFSIEDAAIAQVRVSGLFRADNTAALLDLLEGGFGINAERRGEAEVVLRKAEAR
jgi:transmembrane sensor